VKGKAEIFGAALGKAIRKTTDSMKESSERRAAAAATPSIVRINRRDAPKVDHLSRANGFVDAQVQILIDKASAGAGHTIGWVTLRPGAHHERHRHSLCDAFLVVLKGKGHVLSDLGEEPALEGEVIYAPRGAWHGFSNTSNDEVVLLWGLLGAGSLDGSGYQTERDAGPTADQ
jgi:quercetin dioxygenase-like cupin family protein